MEWINKIIKGDILEILPKMPSDFVDSIITDPPYGLEFMNKKWDKFPLQDRGKRLTGSGKPTEARGFAKNVAYGYSKESLSAYQEFSYKWAKEALRVAKPGAILMAFGGTRTYHRMVCGIEDAGWQIFDCIFWCYGSGFPKSHNIGKAIEKIKVGGIKNLKKIGTKKGIKVETGTQGFSYSKEYVAGKCMGGRQISGDIPIYEINNEWEGYGTALKPAVEPIVCARKPNEGNYAENALKHGVAGLNIDGGRIGKEEISTHNAPKGTFAGGEQDRGSDTNSYKKHQGRFPANLLLDEESAKMLDKQSGNRKGWSSQKHNKFNPYGGNALLKSGTQREGFHEGFNDTGGASRFFYCAKSSKRERQKGCEGLKIKAEGRWNKAGKWQTVERKGNFHPTLKPLALMQYLCTLTKTPMPNGGIVLDPFAGSGTTGIACKKIGRDYILIEQDESYCEIAKARLKAQMKPLL